MIIGIGSDIVDIRRVEDAWKRHGERFYQRIFTEEEIESSHKYRDQRKYHAHFAKRFAAKEAVAKALGTGIGRGGSFRDASVSNLDSGQPVVTLKGGAEARLTAITPQGMHSHIDISLSDDYPFAQAFVVISAD